MVYTHICIYIYIYTLIFINRVAFLFLLGTDEGKKIGFTGRFDCRKLELGKGVRSVEAYEVEMTVFFLVLCKETDFVFLSVLGFPYGIEYTAID